MVPPSYLAVVSFCYQKRRRRDCLPWNQSRPVPVRTLQQQTLLRWQSRRDGLARRLAEAQRLWAKVLIFVSRPNSYE